MISNETESENVTLSKEFIHTFTKIIFQQKK